jgi:hypothetical protein
MMKNLSGKFSMSAKKVKTLRDTVIKMMADLNKTCNHR